MIPFKKGFHKGRIAVYSDRHKLIDSMLYYTSEGMKKIMGKWLRDFPAGFYIQVRPYEDEGPKVIISLPIVTKAEEKLIRPPAEYIGLWDKSKSVYAK